MRTADRARATLRRDHQHGESEETFEARVLARLKQYAGDKYEVNITRQKTPSRYIVSAFGAGDTSPAIRIERETLGACASAFEEATARLSAAFKTGSIQDQRKKS